MVRLSTYDLLLAINSNTLYEISSNIIIINNMKFVQKYT